MTVTSPTTSNGYLKASIFGPATQVLKNAGTLLRLAQLDAALPLNGHERQPILNAIENVWSNGQQYLSTSLGFATAKEIISCHLKALDTTFGTKFYSIYASELDGATTTRALHKCVLRCLKDTQSIQIPPLQKSHRGINGPTLLVCYSRPNREFTDANLNAFAMKWTHLNERCCNHIYDAFSRNFSTDNHSYPFAVPKTHSIDLKGNHLEMHNRSLSDLQPDLTRQLEQKLRAIAETVCPGVEPKDDQILLSERISGDNLIDFAKGKYKDLSQDQKEKLFNQLGQVAMLDVLLGNQDRLVTVGYDEQLEIYQLKISEDDLGSNLGNMMITWAGDTQHPSNSSKSKLEEFLQPAIDPIVYAIDNGICIDLIEGEDDKEQYLQFLRDLCPDPCMEEKLANILTQSIETAVKFYCENQEHVTEVSKKFQSLTDDLKKFGSSSFEQGIKEMLDRLHNTLIPTWDSETTQPLKKHLSSINPHLLQAVTERINVFKSSTRK